MREPAFWYSLRNRRWALGRVAKQLGLRRLQDWYTARISRVVLAQVDVVGINLHQPDRGLLLQSTYPELHVVRHAFRHVAQGYWSSLRHQRQALHEAGIHLGIMRYTDWYEVRVGVTRAHGLGKLLALTSNSLPRLLLRGYPAYSWLPWLFATVPALHWQSPGHARHLLEHVAEALQIATWSDWSCKWRQVPEFPLKSLLDAHGMSLLSLVASLYSFPEATAAPSASPAEKHLAVLALYNNIRRFGDWAAISYTALLASAPAVGAARGATTRKRTQLEASLRACYPEYAWRWGTRVVNSRHHWHSPGALRAFFDVLGHQLAIFTLEDWYQYTAAAIKALGAPLSLFNNSLAEALRVAYPELPWKPWLFLRPPLGFSTNRALVVRYLLWAEHELAIQTDSDWYDVAVPHFVALGGEALLKQHTITELVEQYLPAVSIDPAFNWKANEKSLKNQKLIFRVVSELFPHHPVLFNYRHPELRFPSSGLPVECDIFIPSLDLCIEYQGEWHYKLADWKGSAAAAYLTQTQTRDREKRALLKAQQVSLVEIGYWWVDHIRQQSPRHRTWGRFREAIAASISQVRSDLIDPASVQAALAIPPSSTSHRSERQGYVGRDSYRDLFREPRRAEE